MTNFKNFVPASAYIAGIAAVAAGLAALASYPRQVRMWSFGQGPGIRTRDGARSTVREDKYMRDSRGFGDNYCGARIPANRINRTKRRALAKLEKAS